MKRETHILFFFANLTNQNLQQTHGDNSSIGLGQLLGIY